MLRTDGKTDGVGADPLLQEFFFIELGMSGGSGMDNK